MMLDFNRGVHKELSANAAINAAVDAGIAEAVAQEAPRAYLGASALGHDCLRKIQWDWKQPKGFEPRTHRIFARGHWCEELSAKNMLRAGFLLKRNCPEIAFQQIDGKFRGHGDGLFVGGPEIEGVGYPALWEHKALGSKGWTKLAKDGLAKAYPNYFVQVQIYMAYFGLTEHPTIFTACNMDTMELIHLLVPFDPLVAQAWSDRALTVIQATEAGEVLPRVSDKDDDFRCRFCGHKVECWG